MRVKRINCLIDKHFNHDAVVLSPSIEYFLTSGKVSGEFHLRLNRIVNDMTEFYYCEDCDDWWPFEELKERRGRDYICPECNNEDLEEVT